MAEAQGRLIVGRYALFEELAAGGMATIHFGRQRGAAGFARTVAIKRLHAHHARDPEFVAMFVDEATLASRIRHPNVVPTIDVVQHQGELFLVMEYIEGESLMGLLRAAHRLGERLPVDLASRVVSDILAGLHAAHEAKSDSGSPLHIVHRDVSPSNVIVGTDGVARVLDFGVAKAAVRVSSTRQGGMKGKLRYMAPEQIADEEVTRRTDIYAASVMLWELLVGEPLFTGSNEAAVMARILQGRVTAPSRRDPSLPPAIDDVVLRGLARQPDARWATARELALALEHALPPASAHRTSEWVTRVAADALAQRRTQLARVEGSLQGEPLVPAMPALSEVTKTAAHVPAAATTTKVLDPIDGPTQLVAARHPLSEARARAPWLLVSLGAITATAVALFLLLRPAPTEVETLEHIEPVEPAIAPPNMASTVDAPPEKAPPPIVSAVPSPPPVTRPRVVVRPPPPPSAPNCDPPYTIDAQGRRRAKRECL